MVISEEGEMSNKTTEVIRQKTTGCYVCEVMKTGGMCRRGILAIFIYIFIYIYTHSIYSYTVCEYYRLFVSVHE